LPAVSHRKKKMLAVSGSLVVLWGLTLFVSAAAQTYHRDSAGKQTVWYVSPNGNPSNSGSISSPLDLSTALSGRAIGPGSTVLLRGGTYGGVFTSRLTGSEAQPIVVRSYPHEHAILVDDRARAGAATLNVFGAWTIYRDFEVTNRNPDRSFSPQYRPMGLEIQAPHSKFINLVVHDTGHGFGFWKEAVDSELYGNVIYNCGSENNEENQGHGHAIYAQNDIGTKTIEDNIMFNQYGWGLHAWPNPGGLQGFHIEGNISFNNGVLSGLTNRFNNLHVSGHPPYVASRVDMKANYTYDSPNQTEKTILLRRYMDASVCLECTNPVGQKDVTVEDNYFVGGLPVFLMGGWAQATVTGNVFYGANLLVGLVAGTTYPENYTWDDNTYFGGGPAEHPDAWFFLNLKFFHFEQWKQATGLDRHSKYIPGRPSGVTTFVRPNLYEPGRANIVIYNWDLKEFVDVDLSSVLQVGSHFEVRNVQDYLGKPVAEGVYDGSSVRLPMIGLPVATPIGSRVTPPPTGPEFNVFVIRTLKE